MIMFNSQILTPIFNNIETRSNNNAFCINKTYYTYKELGKVICGIQEDLIKENYESKNIGLVINDDIETYSSIFALWSLGYSYVPLHPNWPIDRCEEIIAEAEISIILDSSITSRFENNILFTKNIRSDASLFKDLKKFPDDDLAYILFTSGSTGNPKGVQISRGNIGNFIQSFWETGITIEESDRCLQCFDLTFDVSIQSYLVSLIKGACCYTIPHNKVKFSYAATLIEDHKITFGAMAPSMVRFLRPYFDELDMSSLKQCILTAEASPLNLVEEWQKIIKDAEVYDFYGPTETTIYCTYYKYQENGPNQSINGLLSIGKPMSNVKAILIDDKCNIVSRGAKGELCIAGPQVSPGYLNNKVKNLESFFDKEIDGSNIRFYRTGDICIEGEDGNLLYIGRKDNQVKIQGFRVELGEIEYHARDFLKGINVVCLAFENNIDLTELSLFIESEYIDTNPLLEYLKSKLPPYMVPGHIYFEPIFPLNTNGKIDKNKLKAKIIK